MAFYWSELRLVPGTRGAPARGCERLGLLALSAGSALCLHESLADSDEVGRDMVARRFE